MCTCLLCLLLNGYSPLPACLPARLPACLPAPWLTPACPHRRLRPPQAAQPMVEELLRELKQQAGLEGPLSARIVEDGDAVAAWEGSSLAAVLFPTGETLGEVRKVAEARPQGLVLIINPQWQGGNVVSDLGFLPWQRKANEQLVASFQEASLPACLPACLPAWRAGGAAWRAGGAACWWRRAAACDASVLSLRRGDVNTDCSGRDGCRAEACSHARRPAPPPCRPTSSSSCA